MFTSTCPSHLSLYISCRAHALAIFCSMRKKKLILHDCCKVWLFLKSVLGHQQNPDLTIHILLVKIFMLWQMPSTIMPSRSHKQKNRELVVSPEKSTVIFLQLIQDNLTSIHRIFLQLIQDNLTSIHRITNQLVPLERNPTLLEFTFDTMYTFATHMTNTIKKAKTKINILKCLSLVMPYKSLSSKINFSRHPATK